MSIYKALVIAHVILFAYWLGADWGVYVNSRYVADGKLSLEERYRFLLASFRIDLMPRIAFTLLPAVGLQIASFYGAWPATGPLMIGVWIGSLLWLAMNVAGYRLRGTPRGEQLRQLDQWVRIVLVVVCIGIGGFASLTGQLIPVRFVAFKLTVFGVMIVVGLVLRAIMKNWALGFRLLGSEGPSAKVDRLFESSLARAKLIAWGMWSMSGLMAFLGIVQPG